MIAFLLHSLILLIASVKATEQRKCITAADEETELDVVELMRCCREDTDDLFYICINNQPNLERHIKLEVIKTVEQSLKVRHLSMAMTGLIDFEVKVFIFYSSYWQKKAKKIFNFHNQL